MIYTHVPNRGVLGVAARLTPKSRDFKPVNAFMKRYRPELPTGEPTRECPECLSAIPAAAKRCAFCTAELR